MLFLEKLQWELRSCLFILLIQRCERLNYVQVEHKWEMLIIISGPSTTGSGYHGEVKCNILSSGYFQKNYLLMRQFLTSEYHKSSAHTLMCHWCLYSGRNIVVLFFYKSRFLHFWSGGHLPCNMNSSFTTCLIDYT